MTANVYRNYRGYMRCVPCDVEWSESVEGGVWSKTKCWNCGQPGTLGATLDEHGASYSFKPTVYRSQMDEAPEDETFSL